jgi:hypothetical protein
VKLFIVQIICLLLILASLGALISLSAYSEAFGIISVQCLSCIKLQPKTVLSFTFETASGEPHPSFILDNLSKGPLFIAFRKDVCEACDIMEPQLKEIFSIEYEKEETFSTFVSFNNTNVTFMHINIDHASKEMKNLFYIYDREHVEGVPMFTIITLGYDKGFVKPCYATAYGVLELREVILDGISLYEKYYDFYNKGFFSGKQI